MSSITPVFIFLMASGVSPIAIDLNVDFNAVKVELCRQCSDLSHVAFILGRVR
jgi:hypothetical protein